MRTQRLLRRPRHAHIFLVARRMALDAGPVRQRSAATLPPGFSETLVASGLSSPTAMQFAPDGRLFVAEQGGRLRVIKDGVLLPTPFLTVTVSSAGERGLLGVAFDPAFSTNRFVYVYYTATTPAIHNRISRFTANGDVAVAGSEVDHPRTQQPQRRDESQRRRARLRPRRQALRRRRRERQRRQRADVHQPARQDAADQQRRNDSDRQPVLRDQRRGTTAPSTRSASAIPSRSPSTRPAPGCSSTTSARTRGKRSTTALPGANYGWPDTEGATTDPRFVSPDIRLQPLWRNLRDHRRRVLRAGDTAVSDGIPERLFLRRLLRRMDPRLDPSAGNSVVTFASRHRLAGRSQGRQTTVACTTWRGDRVPRPASCTASHTRQTRPASPRTRPARPSRLARR